MPRENALRIVYQVEQTGPHGLRAWIGEHGAALQHIGKSVLYSLGAVSLVLLVFVAIGMVSSLLDTDTSQPVRLHHAGGMGGLLSEFVEVHEYGRAADAGSLPAGVLAEFDPITYTVRRGDTISEIAASFGVRMDTLISFNGISDVRAVQADSVIRIPAYANGEIVDGIVYQVRRGDTLTGVAQKLGAELTPILDANRIETDMIRPGDVLFVPEATMSSTDLRRALGTLFVRPVSGRLTSPFGMRVDPFTGARKMHYGVDWANAEGTPVRASNHGTVSVVGESRTFGKHVVINHYDGYQTLYAHLSAVSVREGVRVRQGALIGKLGNTGYSTGPHLHFTIYRNHRPVDPLDYVH